MLDRTFKFVYVMYKDGSPKPSEAFTLVTDIQYYNDYIVIEHYKTPDKVSSAIIMTRTIGGIGIEELSKFDAERDWVKMNNAVCGHDFERIMFWPFDGKKSEIHIYPIYCRQDGIHLVYTSVLGIERKWNHDIKGNELYICMYERNDYDGFGSIDKIVIIPECDIKKFIIKRTDHEDLVINVNGGTYRDE